MSYVNNGTLQREFLTCRSFGLARVDTNARPIVKVGTDDRPVPKFDATMLYVRLVQMIDRSLSLMLQCFTSLMVLSNGNF